MNGNAEFVLHSLWNIKPVQLSIQQMGQITVYLPVAVMIRALCSWH